MDYAKQADITRHADLPSFLGALPGRPVLLTTQGAQLYHQVDYRPDDVLMLGSEGSGAPPQAHEAAALRVRIPLEPGFRSLNVAVAAGIVLCEALRQVGELPS